MRVVVATALRTACLDGRVCQRPCRGSVHPDDGTQRNRDNEESIRVLRVRTKYYGPQGGLIGKGKERITNSKTEEPAALDPLYYPKRKDTIYRTVRSLPFAGLIK